MDELSNYLLSNSGKQASLSPEMLERLGKEAANIFLEKGVSLNEAIPKLAAAYPDINAEQVKRIAEFANNNVYLAKHDQNKTAGASSSYPQFDLADPNRIIQDMTDGARPTIITKTDSDYSRLPQKTKLSSSDSDALFSAVFGIPEIEKRASLDFSEDTAVTEIMNTKAELVALKENLEHTGERFDLLQKEAQEDFYSTIKAHILEGHSFADVLAAARSTGLGIQKISSVMKPLVVRLIKEKVASPAALKRDTEEVEKLAHRIVNDQHPLVAKFGAIASFEEEISKTALALGEVDEQLSKVTSFIKEKFTAKE